MTDPQVFYNQEDLWSWAEEIVTGERLRLHAPLPGELEQLLGEIQDEVWKVGA